MRPALRNRRRHAHGFNPLGTIPEAGQKPGQWIDMSMMQRALAESTVCAEPPFALVSP
jgi:hypothetical protein